MFTNNFDDPNALKKRLSWKMPCETKDVVLDTNNYQVNIKGFYN